MENKKFNNLFKSLSSADVTKTNVLDLITKNKSRFSNSQLEAMNKMVQVKRESFCTNK